MHTRTHTHTKFLYIVKFLHISFYTSKSETSDLNLSSSCALSFVSTMLKIAPRSRMEKELTNHNSQLIELFKCELLIPSSKISKRFLASWRL